MSTFEHEESLIDTSSTTTRSQVPLYGSRSIHSFFVPGTCLIKPNDKCDCCPSAKAKWLRKRERPELYMVNYARTLRGHFVRSFFR